MYAINGLIFLLIFWPQISSQQNDDNNTNNLGNMTLKNEHDRSWLFQKLYISSNKPDKVNVRYKLYNKQFKTDPFQFSYKSDISVLEPVFDPELPIIFIIQGWETIFAKNTWSRRLSLNFVQEDENINVFDVDWQGGAENMNYIQVVADMKLAAKLIAKFIQQLGFEYGVSPSQISMTGLSLGGQMPGFIGKYFKSPKIKRIIALDPAKPLLNSRRPQRRLANSDADLVEVVYTDYGNLGMSRIAGHVNIFVNGGGKQPGCSLYEQSKKTGNIFKPLVSGCDHLRSVILMFDNYNQTYCQPVAYACDSYKDFKKGKCIDCGANNENCWLFAQGPAKGLTLSPPKKTHYYLKTAAKQPFCVNHYAIGFATLDDQPKTRASIKVNVEYESSSPFEDKFGYKIDAKNNYWRVFTTPHTGLIDSVKRVTLKLRQPLLLKAGSYFSKKYRHQELHITDLQIKLMSLWNPKMRSKFMVNLCRESDGHKVAHLLPKKSVSFVPC